MGAVLTAEVQRIKGDINAARAALACVADAVFALQSIVKDASGSIRPVLCTYTAHKPHMLIERLRTLLKGTG